jgi:hypothetical protein
LFGQFLFLVESRRRRKSYKLENVRVIVSLIGRQQSCSGGRGGADSKSIESKKGGRQGCKFEMNASVKKSLVCFPANKVQDFELMKRPSRSFVCRKGWNDKNERQTEKGKKEKDRLMKLNGTCAKGQTVGLSMPN